MIESRSLANGASIRRRRECLACGYRFTSYERIEEKPLMVIKKSDNRREPFDRDKLERSIQLAMRKRAVSQNVIENMVNEIEENALMFGRESHEVHSHQLGKMILDRLYDLDRVAYIRFASVYRNFENVEEFIREIETLSDMKEQNATIDPSVDIDPDQDSRESPEGDSTNA
ncbi:MAG: transcriptional regulator NrdR [Spirochaetota bacterium]